MADLPVDNVSATCMVCKVRPEEKDVGWCSVCASPWHIACLRRPFPQDALEQVKWSCPDCSPSDPPPTNAPAASAPVPPREEDSAAQAQRALLEEIKAINNDPTLSDQAKAQKRQKLMSGQAGAASSAAASAPAAKGKGKRKSGADDSTSSAGGTAGEGAAATAAKGKVAAKGAGEKSAEPAAGSTLAIIDENLKCNICLSMCERPVTTPCGHNNCMKCIQKWAAQGKVQCPKCRAPIPKRYASDQLRINTALVAAIKLAKMGERVRSSATANAQLAAMANAARPEKAFTTDRAVRAGKANAASGRIMVTVTSDHFGPIGPEADPERGLGVLVGESWEDRLECRQWGAHRPHVAGIAGQSDVGAQSVALSGGYEDDEDNGDWFLYTGSGGRDLSGNKRTNKEQSFDQTFTIMNKALKLSCIHGWPVRVVRSHKEKRSAYAPEQGVRYDGIYRIEKCWRKPGAQGKLMCRYLFVRCDNEPAPWSSEELGDRPRPSPVVSELKNLDKVKDYTERKGPPAWDFSEAEGKWGWTRAPPVSRDNGGGGGGGVSKKRAVVSLQQKLLKEFSCPLCKKTLTNPVSTPCGHSFCQPCLTMQFQGVADTRERGCGRSLRVQKVEKRCPRCPADISEFLQNPAVNNEMLGLIADIQKKIEDQKKEEASGSGAGEKEEEGEEDGEAEEEQENEEEADEEASPVKSEGKSAGQSKGKSAYINPKRSSTPGKRKNAPTAEDVVEDSGDGCQSDDGNDDGGSSKAKPGASKKAKAANGSALGDAKAAAASRKTGANGSAEPAASTPAVAKGPATVAALAAPAGPHPDALKLAEQFPQFDIAMIADMLVRAFYLYSYLFVCSMGGLLVVYQNKLYTNGSLAHIPVC
eukprot:jgi/Mesvir1/18388/Mv14270-RA.3